MWPNMRLKILTWFFHHCPSSCYWAWLPLGLQAQPKTRSSPSSIANPSPSLNHLASELISTVLADGIAYGGLKLSFANGVWVDNRLTSKPVFKQTASNNYKAACEQVDFQIKADQVAHKVNSWVEKSTNGLIKDILPTGSVDRTTRLILANALYFKGVWKQKFDPSRTRDLDFHLLNGGSVKVLFMSTTTKQYICAFNGFKVLCLRYSQGRDNRQFSMYIFLPEARDGLPSLMQIASSQPGFLEQHLPHCQADVHICMIPRFKFSFGFEVSKTLKQLGLVFPFSEGGLTEMVDSSLGANLFVSRIFHKSFIEVNEEGTEAAAVIMLKSLDLTNKFEFIADHPFLFFIQEDTTVAELENSCVNYEVIQKLKESFDTHDHHKPKSYSLVGDALRLRARCVLIWLGAHYHTVSL